MLTFYHGYSLTGIISNITVSGEANMTPIGTLPTFEGNNAVQLFYLPSMTSGGSKTVTFNGNVFVSNINMEIYEVYDTVVGAIALDGFNGAADAVGSANPTMNIVTGSDHSLILGGITGNVSAPTAGAGYTLDDYSFWNFEMGQYKPDAGTAGTVTFNWTLASSVWTMAAAGFKAASSSAVLWAQSIL